MRSKFLDAIDPFREPERGFIFEVTARCNNKCLYCYNIWKREGAPMPADIPADEWTNIVDKLCRETKVRLITISGGEPFLREDLSSIVKHIASKRLGITLITNGTLLTEGNVAGTVDSVTLYEVPLLADRADVHDYLAGAKAYDKVLDGIGDIVQHGGRFAASFVATNVNAPYLEGACEMAIALGASSILYNRFNPGGEGLRNIGLLSMTLETLKGHLDLLEGISEKHDIKVHCGVPIPPCIVDTAGYKNVTFGHCPGGGEQAYYTIGPDAMMRMCNHSPTVLGDFRNEPFRKLKGSAAARAFRESFPLECTKCPDLKRCNGGCKAAQEQAYGTIHDKEAIIGMIK